MKTQDTPNFVFLVQLATIQIENLEERIFETINSAIEKRSLFVECIVTDFARRYDIKKVLRALR